MTTQWFYRTGEGQPSGPVDSAELRRLAEAGVVRPDTLVWQCGSDGWIRADQVRGLFQRSTAMPSSAGESPPPPVSVPRPSTSHVRQDQEAVPVSSALSGTLPEFGRYVVATIACGAILLLYVVACLVFEWKYGGGTIVMCIFFGAVAATWKTVTGLCRKRNEQLPEPASSNARETSSSASTGTTGLGSARTRKTVPEASLGDQVMTEPPPVKTEDSTHKLIRHPYARWIPLACGFIFAFVVLLTAVYAYRHYVSSTRYYMIQTQEGEVYEIDRRTGETWVIRGTERTTVEDKEPEPTACVLPDAEMEKIDSKLEPDYEGKINDIREFWYNGTDWEVNQVTLTVTAKFKDGKSWTRKYVEDVHGKPFAAFHVGPIYTGDYREVDDLTWHLNEVRGFPPSEE